MSEHRIRLRGAWDCNTPGDEEAEEGSSRLDLPTVWTAETRFPVQLVRRFGRPPHDPASERVVLELRNVPGLLSLRLNGAEIPLKAAPGPEETLTISLDRTLLPRNALLLEISDQAIHAPEFSWGEIAIKITST